MTLFHISRPENRESIREKGIVPNKEGQVFLYKEGKMYTQPFVIDGEVEYHNWSTERKIAVSQLFLSRYDVWMVEVPSKKLEKDDVAEYSADQQFIYKGRIRYPKLVARDVAVDIKHPWDR